MNRIESIRKAALKSGLAGGMKTEFPMYKLETFANSVIDDAYEFLISELNKQPLNDTATSIAQWIKSQK